MNAMCTVSGFSPAQWVLGYQPQFTGDLLSEELAPSQLGGSQTFEETLSLRTAANLALIRADEDQRLRRALLRRYAGTNVLLQPGQLCWYWRDARASDLCKIRWLGPARVILREDQDDGKPLQYTGCPMEANCFDVLPIMFGQTSSRPLTPWLETSLKPEDQ